MLVKLLPQIGQALFGEDFTNPLAEALELKPSMLQAMLDGKAGPTPYTNRRIRSFATAHGIDLEQLAKDYEEYQSHNFNEDYLLRVGALISTLQPKSEVEDLVSPLHFTCIPTQRLVDAYLKHGPDLSHICFMLEGMWFADLCNEHNRDKDQAFYSDAVVKMPDGVYNYNYDLIKHKELDAQYRAKNKD